MLQAVAVSCLQQAVGRGSQGRSVCMKHTRQRSAFTVFQGVLQEGQCHTDVRGYGIAIRNGEQLRADKSSKFNATQTLRLTVIHFPRCALRL